jgi:hypothetical protein
MTTAELENAKAFLAEVVEARSPNPPGNETLVAKAIIRKGGSPGPPGLRLRNVIARARLHDPVAIDPAVPPQNWIFPGEQVRDKRLLDAAKFAWKKVLGREPSLAVMSAGTDSTHANKVGIPALPAFGPGSLGVAHQPNESLPEEDIPIALDMFETFIRAYHRGTPYV